MAASWPATSYMRHIYSGSVVIRDCNCIAQQDILCLQGITKRFSKGLDEANTARSSLRPTEKVLATQHSNRVQVKLDDDLQSLVRRLQPVNMHATMFLVYVGREHVHDPCSFLGITCVCMGSVHAMHGGCQRLLTHSET